MVLIVIHTIFCILPPVVAPRFMCGNNKTNWDAGDEQYVRWLLLTLFCAVPLFLDICFDFFKLTGEVVEKNQWYSRIILLLALTVPNLILLVAQRQELSAYDQCRFQSAVVPAQSMILICSVFCMMYRRRTYMHPVDDGDKNRFSIENRAVLAMLHLALTRILVFVYIVLGAQNNGLRTIVMIANALVIAHIVFVCVAYLYVLVRQRRNGLFTTHHALNDFLYMISSFVFLNLGFILTIGVDFYNDKPDDLAATRLSILRQGFLVCFTLFITVIPGRVFRLSAKLEHEKLQTRLNLIRYVSHEMRSPLNTAFLGLEYVTEELSRLHMDLISHRHILTHNSGESPAFEVSDKFGRSGGSHYATSRAGSPPQGADDSSSKFFESNKMAGGSTKSGLSDVLDIVKQINASCNIALFTLNDLLTFDKLDEKKLEVELQPVNAWHFVLETAKPFKINAKESKVDFTISCEGFHSKWYRQNFLRADEFKLSQVLRNLISNALKFTPAQGKVHMKVEMLPNYPTSGIMHNGSTLGSILRIAVTDTGPGISKPNLHKLFGQYVQFNPSKLQKGGGSGLGLWISKSIVELHGGTVRATSEGEGHGCTFIMELPLFQRAADGSLVVGRPATLASFEMNTIPEAGEEEPASTSQHRCDSDRDLGANCNGAEVHVQSPMSPASSVHQSPDAVRAFPSAHSTPGQMDLETGQMQDPPATAGSSFLSSPPKIVSSPGSAKNMNVKKKSNRNLTSPPQSFFGWLFSAGGTVKQGAQQFLNQNVTIVSARPDKRYLNAKLDPNNVSDKDLYRNNSEVESSAEGDNNSNEGNFEELPRHDSAFVGGAIVKKASATSMKTASYYSSSRVVPFDDQPSDTTKTITASTGGFARGNSLRGVDTRASTSTRVSGYYGNAASAFTPLTSNTNSTSVPTTGDNGSFELSPQGTTPPFSVVPPPIDIACTTAGRAAPSWKDQLRFLAVDDAALNRKMMGRILCSAGHVVDEAGDGTECLKIMNCPYRGSNSVPKTPHTPATPMTPSTTSMNLSTSRHHSHNSDVAPVLNLSYDAILMDENMPEMSGPETASWLRKAGYKGIIIGVTGDCYEDQMAHFVDMGANIVLPKPLKVDKLKATLEEMWQSSSPQ
eukprot:CAMPEP_0184975770 /NCGR_PEP_ID=MMETSP1098-20130426/6903_1 /TAXON_ID=89044 /ORGANISM="Spumella elongata, Strain CCAP 955/1" /LENGTH=1124 /DNA_ID=CAMNT_0027498543 /DNA_START=134 /DNA_END=3508 /DNA_ORIENTATION=+